MAVYFAQDRATGLIKIGHTEGDVADRLKTLQTGCPGELVLLLVESGNHRDEKVLHARFALLRERGEWFRPGPELIFYLIACARESGYQTGRSHGYQDGWHQHKRCFEAPIPPGWDQEVVWNDPVDDFADLQGEEYEIIGAALWRPEGETSYQFRIDFSRIDGAGGLARGLVYVLNGQEVMNALGSDLILLGLDADKWGTPDRPLSRELPQALILLKGVRFRGWDDEQGFHIASIVHSCRATAAD
jgi:Meiotically up-regulated gene 113